MTFLRGITVLAVVMFARMAASQAAQWDCEILPAEQKVETDAQSGAKITFLTTHPASDTNFYFHDRCFLWNNRFMLFRSDRFGRSEVMGCFPETGALVRLNQPQDPAVGSLCASFKGDRIYAFKDGAFYLWKLDFAIEPKAAVHITETKIAGMPEGGQLNSTLTENSDGTLVAYAYKFDNACFIGFFNPDTGQALPPTKLDFEPGHLQFHWTRPDLLGFCRVYGTDLAPLDPAEPRHARFWFMNVNTRVPVPGFYQVPGEITTHECWWVNDQMTFVDGHHHDGEREEGNVKVFDLKTGDIRIIGAGAWLDDASAEQLSKVNWWHASGSPNGKWVVADNWQGIIALFNAKTTEKKILATGHRTYGHGQHLHAGWDLAGKRVEFTSNKLGNPDVCIAEVPEGW